MCKKESRPLFIMNILEDLCDLNEESFFASPVQEKINY